MIETLEPSTPDSLDDLLKKLLGAIPEVKAAAIVSAEGLPIASALPQGVDETRFAAMTAALLSLSEKAIIEMNKGEFVQLYIKGSDGYLLILQAGLNAVLAVLTSKDVRLGLLNFKIPDFFGGLTPFPTIPPDPPASAGSIKSKSKPGLKKEPPEELDCPFCGYEIPKGQKYCPICGKDIF